MTPDQLPQAADAPAGSPTDFGALIEIARMRQAARAKAPLVLDTLKQVRSPHHRAMCIHTLGSILEDQNGDDVHAVVTVLTAALEDPSYRRMRGKLARTLYKIGLAARGAIPALARTLRAGGRGSVRVPVRGALWWFAWVCWHGKTWETQRFFFAALEGFSKSYQIWMFREALALGTDSNPLRIEAEQLYARLIALTPPSHPATDDAMQTPAQ